MFFYGADKYNVSPEIESEWLNTITQLDSKICFIQQYKHGCSSLSKVSIDVTPRILLEFRTTSSTYGIILLSNELAKSIHRKHLVGQAS